MNYREESRLARIPEASLRAAEEILEASPELPGLRDPEIRSPQGLGDYASGLENRETGALALFLSWLPELHQAYQEKNIPETVFLDSIQDLGIWCRDHEAKTGRPGLTQWDWVGKTFRMELFRLGRLQFEPRTLEEPIAAGEIRLPAGTEILEIHIPAEAPLKPQAVEDSLRAAGPFFRDRFGKTYAWAHCHSWLLGRELQQLLPEGSGILNFQKKFTLYREDYDFAQAEERVFGRISEDPEAYPEKTGLQKSLKQWLLAGKKAGMGAGILRLP